jgi:hypothetical protein
MQTTTSDLAHRPGPAPLQQQPVPVAPVVADLGLVARRGLGNDLLQRRANCGDPDLAGCPGGCGGCALSRTVQPKLTVGATGGPDEQEADRVADRVVGMDGGATAVASGPRVDVQRVPATGSAGMATVDAPLPSGAGRPLSRATQACMEPCFAVLSEVEAVVPT